MPEWYQQRDLGRPALEKAYNDWFMANASKYDTGPDPDFPVMRGDWRARGDYSRMIQEQNADIYDQYAQYQNKAFNDYYQNPTAPGFDFERYSPYNISRFIVPAVMLPPRQDALGQWVDPLGDYGRDNPGVSFDEWYYTQYKQPNYQRLDKIQRIDPGFKMPDWMKPGMPDGSQGFPVAVSPDSQPQPIPTLLPAVPFS